MKLKQMTYFQDLNQVNLILNGRKTVLYVLKYAVKNENMSLDIPVSKIESLLNSTYGGKQDIQSCT